jgi:hypothetical protein
MQNNRALFSTPATGDDCDGLSSGGFVFAHTQKAPENLQKSQNPTQLRTHWEDKNPSGGKIFLKTH